MSRSLLIVDLQSHSLGGHFRLWLGRTIREAARHFDTLHVYVADDMSVPDLDTVHACLPCRTEVHLIPAIYRARRSPDDIMQVICDHYAAWNPGNPRAPIFLMWAQQFLERDLIFPPHKSWVPRWKSRSLDFSWGSLTSVSSVAHDAASAPLMERRIHEEISSDPKCVGLLLWDEVAARKLGGIYLYLPDVEPLESDPNWEMPPLESITIGSVGQLWGYRSMNLLAEILARETDLKGYVAGVFKPESYTPEALKLIEGTRDHFLTEEGFVADEQVLNTRLKKLDAFVLDSRSYKCPSGLGIRAMALGRPVIAPDSPSWIATLIREEGVGVFWEAGAGTLANDLRRWYDSGGRERSAATAKRLSDREHLEKAYGILFDRLKKSVQTAGDAGQ